MEYMENSYILIHKLNNVLGLIESCINRLKCADEDALKKRWLFMKDVITATGRDRIDKEIEFYKKPENTIEDGDEETYNNNCKKLSEANGYYKAIFDLLDGQDGSSEENRNMTLTNGDKLVGILKGIINQMKECSRIL
jgi:hypothetical protein